MPHEEPIRKYVTQGLAHAFLYPSGRLSIRESNGSLFNYADWREFAKSANDDAMIPALTNYLETEVWLEETQHAQPVTAEDAPLHRQPEQPEPDAPQTLFDNIAELGTESQTSAPASPARKRGRPRKVQPETTSPTRTAQPTQPAKLTPERPAIAISKCDYGLESIADLIGHIGLPAVLTEMHGFILSAAQVAGRAGLLSSAEKIGKAADLIGQAHAQVADC